MGDLASAPSSPGRRGPAAGQGSVELVVALGKEHVGSIRRDYLDISKGLRHKPLNLDEQT